MPADPNCPHCEGSGHIFVDSLTARRCSCLLRDLYARKMGFMIWNAATIQKSPLTNKLRDNVLVVADDEDMNPHLKLSFVHMGLNANWVYIDDSNVLQAWLGANNSAQAENLQDLISYPFLVLRLGTVGYPNKALPGVICELLMGRVLAGRPSWVVTPRELRAETCREYSDELMYLLGRYFERVKLKGVKKQRRVQRAPEPDPEEETEDAVMEAYPDDPPEDIVEDDSVLNPTARGNLALRNMLRGKK